MTTVTLEPVAEQLKEIFHILDKLVERIEEISDRLDGVESDIFTNTKDIEEIEIPDECDCECNRDIETLQADLGNLQCDVSDLEGRICDNSSRIDETC